MSESLGQLMNHKKVHIKKLNLSINYKYFNSKLYFKITKQYVPDNSLPTLHYHLKLTILLMSLTHINITCRLMDHLHYLNKYIYAFLLWKKNEYYMSNSSP